MKILTGLLIKELITSSFWFSYSERLPLNPEFYEQQTGMKCPTDRERIIGFKTKNFYSEVLKERENGYHESGRENRYLLDVKDLNFKNEKIGTFKVGGKDFERTSKDIQYQEQYAVFSCEWNKFPIEFEAGVSYIWLNWFKKPSICQRVGISFHKFVDIQFSQTTDFGEKCFRDLYVGKSWICRIPHLDFLDFRVEVFKKYLWDLGELKYSQVKAALNFEIDLSNIFESGGNNE